MLVDNRYGEMDHLLDCEPSWAVFARGSKIVVVKGLRI